MSSEPQEENRLSAEERATFKCCLFYFLESPEGSAQHEHDKETLKKYGLFDDEEFASVTDDKCSTVAQVRVSVLKVQLNAIVKKEYKQKSKSSREHLASFQALFLQCFAALEKRRQMEGSFVDGRGKYFLTQAAWDFLFAAAVEFSNSPGFEARVLEYMSEAAAGEATGPGPEPSELSLLGGHTSDAMTGAGGSLQMAGRSSDQQSFGGLASAWVRGQTAKLCSTKNIPDSFDLVFRQEQSLPTLVSEILGKA
ncbi:hypothetical protein NliqN6_5449 [Naganishia liquefaciens]|uniref:Uncharacterized protein n=1 Tax=Naganishia liquefaciens TaxID=104408 RepID=A0A8H3TXP6_9TREE|nr:hypothetical protein NliqN6_5449 [Naganishia liquefaciens]